MKTIYDVIEVVPFDGHNWFINSAHLENVIKKNNIKTIIEVGSWLGGSTRFFANILPEDGYVIAVDHWQGSAEHQPGGPAYNPKLPILYQQFLSNCIHEKLAHKIIPVRMSSLEAAKAINLCPDLFYLDGSHDEESVYLDLTHWYPKLSEKTIICGDDWCYEGVQKAVERFGQENNLKFNAAFNGNFWIYEK